MAKSHQEEQRREVKKETGEAKEPTEEAQEGSLEAKETPEEAKEASGEATEEAAGEGARDERSEKREFKGRCQYELRSKWRFHIKEDGDKGDVFTIV